jgi:sugar O-acyltransferase (sialic acid O-acetyltransferase NeuD family)
VGTIIFGAGPFAALLNQQLLETGHEVAGFVVDAEYRNGDTFADRPFLDWDLFLKSEEYSDCDLLVGVGYRDMTVRARAAERILDHGRELGTFIHPRAYVSPAAEVSPGCILFAGAVVEPFVRIGRNNLIWSNSTICHDTVIGEHNYISPAVAISGNCTIGQRSFLGTGSRLIDGVTVGDDCHVAPGSVVCGNTDTHSFYAGVPAVKKRTFEGGVRIAR